MPRKKTKAVTRYRRRCAKKKCVNGKLAHPTATRCCKRGKRSR